MKQAHKNVDYKLNRTESSRISLALPAGPRRRQGEPFLPPIQVLKHEDAQLWGGNPAMLGPSASLVIIVYGERHSHALGSKRPFLLSDCRQVTGSGIRKPGPQAPLFPYLSSPYMLYPKAQ